MIAGSQLVPIELTITQAPVREVLVRTSMVKRALYFLGSEMTDSACQVYREPGLSDAEYEKIKRNML